DSTPVVLTYVLNGAASYAVYTPLTTDGRNGYQQVPTPRVPLTTGQSTYALGRARTKVFYGDELPFRGQFATGSMSLLEVSYANRALSPDQVQALHGFYASLYHPVTTSRDTGDLTRAGVGGERGAAIEQILIYGRD